MMSFHGMAFDAICGFRERYPAAAIGRVARRRIEGHDIVTMELSPQGDDERRFEVVMSDGRHSRSREVCRFAGGRLQMLGDVG